MVRFLVSASSIIQAPAEEVYNVLKDYNNEHAHIIPRKFFDGMRVLRGSGVGEGTRFEAHFKTFGQRTTLVMDVSEPEPGRILQEIDTQAVNITKFIVDPIVDNDSSCNVTIRTDVMKERGWVAGTIDMWIKRKIMTHMYEEELKTLNQHMQSKRGRRADNEN